MNVIRTKAIELDTIPAIAYKIKLASGGSGIKLHRTDREDTVFTVVDKRTGGAVIDAGIDPDLFPEAAFDEAIETLAGMPYSSRGKVKLEITEKKDDEEVDADEDDQPDEIDMLSSPEFKAVIERYSDETGRINYVLMNKQFIQFAAGSKVVNEMVSKKATVEEIVLFVLKNRAAFLAGRKDFVSDDEAKALYAVIDEIDPRSAFKELSLHIRRMMSKR
ncbi:MAG: hypothetical protein FWE82_09795 [Defluviitaleaceae bacterium]|nr:hypothetical protein [Defluviitaleaceae bacterium]